MAVLISAFPVNRNDGAGWVSKRIAARERFASVVARRDSSFGKSLWALWGILAFPFLHPIFTRYAPVWSRAVRRDGELWLNLSQTFALGLCNRNSVMVCHDLQCHYAHRLRAWVRWSERILLNRAERVLVLSARDAGVVNRYYGVPVQRIENIGPLLVPELRAFTREFPGEVRSIAFLGSMVRKENREGLMWFVQHVLPACPQVQVAVIGERAPDLEVRHPRVRYLGFVDDLQREMAEHTLMIAPMFSRAGIKIKVVEALLNETPVLGTVAAYGGLSRPEGRWCSNRPDDWISILNEGGTYVFRPPRHGPVDPRSREARRVW